MADVATTRIEYTFANDANGGTTDQVVTTNDQLFHGVCIRHDDSDGDKVVYQVRDAAGNIWNRGTIIAGEGNTLALFSIPIILHGVTIRRIGDGSNPTGADTVVVWSRNG